MIRELVQMRTDIEALKSAFGHALRVGVVALIDPSKGYRLNLGAGEDGPVLSPWLPHPETGKTSVPLKTGQVVGILSPAGDLRQGLVLRGGYSDANESPNDNMDANVFEDAGVRVTVADGALVIKVGPVTHKISADGVDTTGGHVRHNETNIGDTHVHGGVIAGGSNTAGPQ